jgi:ParB-like chromosome segregation protein Spo0J
MTGGDLKEARLAHGWTQEQLGEMLGETKTVIGNWERGKRVPPRKEHAVREVLFPSGTGDDYLRRLSDTALIAELARRLALRDEGRSNTTGTAGTEPNSPPATKVSKGSTSARGIAGPHSPPRRSAR